MNALRNVEVESEIGADHVSMERQGFRDAQEVNSMRKNVIIGDAIRNRGDTNQSMNMACH